ncbi:hypothetical protein Tco_0546158 [Tanacetum coccineum]
MSKALNIVYVTYHEVSVNVISISCDCCKVIIFEADCSHEFLYKISQQFNIASHMLRAPTINNPKDELDHLHHMRKHEWKSGQFGYLFLSAFGKLLEDIHVTWTQFGKKRTRLQLYTKVDEE